MSELKKIYEFVRESIRFSKSIHDKVKEIIIFSESIEDIALREKLLSIAGEIDKLSDSQIEKVSDFLDS